MLATSEAQAQRLKELRAAFKRMLPIRLTNLEKAVMDRAARLTLRAEIAAGDPGVLINDVVRIDGAAHRARNAWARLCSAKQRTSPAPSLKDYLEHRHGVQV